MHLNTKNTAIVSTAMTLAATGAIALGVLGNNLADESRERTAVACVTAGGSWVQVPNVGTYECKR